MGKWWKPKFAHKNAFKVPISPQRFTIPENIIYYMIMNPSSPKVYQKLIQCCKYFFPKNRIIPVRSLSTCDYDLFCTVCPYVDPRRDSETLDLKNAIFKLWITQDLTIDPETPRTTYDSLMSKICRCEITSLSLENQGISLQDFEMLTASGNIVTIFLYNLTITDSDGKKVPMEAVFKYLPKIKNCYL